MATLKEKIMQIRETV